MIEHSFDRNVLVSTIHSNELNATCINANNTHATVHATCDCDMRHAMHATVTAWLAVSIGCDCDCGMQQVAGDMKHASMSV